MTSLVLGYLNLAKLCIFVVLFCQILFRLEYHGIFLYDLVLGLSFVIVLGQFWECCFLLFGVQQGYIILLLQIKGYFWEKIHETIFLEFYEDLFFAVSSFLVIF